MRRILLLLLLLLPVSVQAQCDLNQDGLINVLDVQLLTDMILGSPPCAANFGVCNNDVSTVVGAVLNVRCVSVSLNWVASISSNVIGYDIYRSAQDGGPYSQKLTPSPVAGTSFVDLTVKSGITYYYVATAVDSGSNESAYSNSATAAVP